MADIIFLGFIVLLGVLLIFGIYDGVSKKESSRKTARLLSTDGGAYGRNFISEDGKQGLTLSEDRKSIIVFQSGFKNNIVAKDIVSVEVLRDGSVITKTNRGSQVGGALVGAALLGPLGLLVGGVTGSKKQVERLKSLTLRIVIRNNVRPYVDVKFYDGPSVPADQIRAKIQEAQDALSTVQSVIS